jgi:hypothetical protein
MLIYFKAIWTILQIYLGYFMTIWYILFPFGTIFWFWYHVPRQIWQPWSTLPFPGLKVEQSVAFLACNATRRFGSAVNIERKWRRDAKPRQ